MKDDVVDDQTELIELIENAGWTITAVELRQYGQPWRTDGDVTGAEIELTVRKDYAEEDEDRNPYRIT